MKKINVVRAQNYYIDILLAEFKKKKLKVNLEEKYDLNDSLIGLIECETELQMKVNSLAELKYESAMVELLATKDELAPKTVDDSGKEKESDDAEQKEKMASPNKDDKKDDSSFKEPDPPKPKAAKDEEEDVKNDDDDFVKPIKINITKKPTGKSYNISYTTSTPSRKSSRLSNSSRNSNSQKSFSPNTNISSANTSNTSATTNSTFNNNSITTPPKHILSDHNNYENIEDISATELLKLTNVVEIEKFIKLIYAKYQKIRSILLRHTRQNGSVNPTAFHNNEIVELKEQLLGLRNKLKETVAKLTLTRCIWRSHKYNVDGAMTTINSIYSDDTLVIGDKIAMIGRELRLIKKIAAQVSIVDRCEQYVTEINNFLE